MEKFKPGDRVVRVRSDWMKGYVATLVKKMQDTTWTVKLDSEFCSDDRDWGWVEQYMELESIYNSTLYKALNEEE